MAVFRCIHRLEYNSVSVKFLPGTRVKRYYCHKTSRFDENVQEIDSSLSTSNKPSASKETINRIEKLSLVGFQVDHGLTVLEAAINFTERLRTTTVCEAVKPMSSTLENELIPLRDDTVKNNIKRQKILMNAAVREEEYFVAPLGNTAKTS